MLRRVIWVALALTLVSLPAMGHSPDELAEWQDGWFERVHDHGGIISPRLMDEWQDWRERHPCSEVLGTPCKPRPVARASSSSGSSGSSAARGMGSNVEQWRDLVVAHFGDNAARALRVMACESGGNPNAMHPRSKASGLFQFLPSTWKTVTGETYPGNVFDGPSNIAAAAKLSKGGSTWQQWSCKP